MGETISTFVAGRVISVVATTLLVVQITQLRPSNLYDYIDTTATLLFPYESYPAISFTKEQGTLTVTCVVALNRQPTV
jgi:hypothetical protein